MKQLSFLAVLLALSAVQAAEADKKVEENQAEQNAEEQKPVDETEKKAEEVK